uniref:Uncharacterized protein n=1 Tax=Picea glauca TaxID=3330 RepID=A0A117NIM8_PICGL|nr:hypothetical protein ABT39_MTgene66 [Picea glauca]QHR90767.1 hypothetical protein Q903MT_gene4793 [Picea sitchensis]
MLRCYIIYAISVLQHHTELALVTGRGQNSASVTGFPALYFFPSKSLMTCSYSK